MKVVSLWTLKTVRSVCAVQYTQHYTGLFLYGLRKQLGASVPCAIACSSCMQQHKQHYTGLFLYGLRKQLGTCVIVGGTQQQYKQHYTGLIHYTGLFLYGL